jgi:hypothetical protein
MHRRDSLPVAWPPPILLVRPQSGDSAITGCIVVDGDIGCRACAVKPLIDQNLDCNAALSEDGGGRNKALGKMHFGEANRPRMLFLIAN